MLFLSPLGLAIRKQKSQLREDGSSNVSNQGTKGNRIKAKNVLRNWLLLKTENKINEVLSSNTERSANYYDIIG